MSARAIRSVRAGQALRLSAVALLLSGCSLIPDYYRPALPVSARYPAGDAYPAPAPNDAAPDASISWQRFFASDPTLRQLIALALANNRDLRVSTLTVIAARATYREQRGALFPTLDATGGFPEHRTPTDIYSYGGNATGTSALAAAASGAGASSGFSTGGTTLKEWSLGLGVSS